jgi:hypothetical protein
MPIIKKFIIFSPEYSLLYTSKTFKISFQYIKDYPEKKSSHSDTMGVIFPYFWFSDREPFEGFNLRSRFLDSTKSPFKLEKA